MMAAGTLMITFQPHKGSKKPKLNQMRHESGGKTLIQLSGLPNFWRAIISNPAVTKADVDFCISEMERLGADI